MTKKRCNYHHCKNDVKNRKYCSSECQVFDKNKTVPAMKKRVWSLFSEFIRKLYADVNGYVRCYTCGKLLHWKDCQAGHYKHGDNVGTWNNEKNVKPQCAACNMYLSGNLSVYATRLEAEYGYGILQELEKAYHSKPLTWNIEPLREAYRDLKKKLDELA